jgi:hypothetical protein
MQEVEINVNLYVSGPVAAPGFQICKGEGRREKLVSRRGKKVSLRK